MTTRTPVAPKVAKRATAKRASAPPVKKARAPRVKAFQSFTLTGHLAYDLRDALTMAASAAASDDSRPVLTGVAVSINDGTLSMASADGFRLVRVSMPVSAIGVMPQCVIADGSIKRVAALIDSAKGLGDAIEVVFTPTDVTVRERGTDSGDVHRFSFIAATYPNYENLIPAARMHRDWKFAMNAKYLGDVAALARKFTDSGILRVTPGATPHSPIRFDWRNESWDATAVVMPMYVQW